MSSVALALKASQSGISNSIRSSSRSGRRACPRFFANARKSASRLRMETRLRFLMACFSTSLLRKKVQRPLTHTLHCLLFFC